MARHIALSRSDLVTVVTGLRLGNGHHFMLEGEGNEDINRIQCVFEDLLQDASGDDFTLSEEE